MKKLKALLYLTMCYGLSTGVYASEADTFYLCAHSSISSGQWGDSSFFKTCLLSPAGTKVLESRFEQTKNYFPINYALKFVNGSSATMRLTLVNAKYCKNPSEVVMLSVKQGVYSGRTCVFLKSHQGIAVDVVATSRVPSFTRGLFLPSFRLQIYSMYCSDFVPNACSFPEYLNINFRLEKDILDWGSSKRFGFLSPQSQAWRLPTGMP